MIFEQTQFIAQSCLLPLSIVLKSVDFKLPPLEFTLFWPLGFGFFLGRRLEVMNLRASKNICYPSN